MPHTFDLICLGTGPAASTVATMCAKQGRKVAIVESRELGGTCALHGCNPKKVFTNAAALIDQFRRAQGHLTRGGDPRIEWSDLIAFQHEFTQPVPELTAGKFEKFGIKVLGGFAQFETPGSIRVGETVLEAPTIFIGVGARPVPLKIPGEELVATSDDFMELDSLPAEILFLGGGYISFEFAHLAARAGAQSKIVDRHALPLKSFDPDLVRLLMKSSATVGVEILTGTEATAIARRNGRLDVTLKGTNGERSLTADLVVHGGGRVPNLDGMKLEAGGVAHGKRGITVNEFLQSPTNAAVYAAGDCADTGVQKLTPVANESARIAAENILARLSNASCSQRRVDYGPVPQVVFSVPPLAGVGLSEADARSQGFNVDVRYEDLSTKGEVRKLCAAAAGCKLIIDRKSDQILGAHLLGPHADEVINLFALALRCKLTTASFKSMLFTYPTMTAEYCRVL